MKTLMSLILMVNPTSKHKNSLSVEITDFGVKLDVDSILGNKIISEKLKILEQSK